jgi:hypothetical protein
MARWAQAIVVVGGALGFVGAIAAACLPSLATNLCGNGRIDPPETCDPGLASNPGCPTNCQVACPTDAAASLLDDKTFHCYYTATAGFTPWADASAACQAAQAHLVTFVDDNEVDEVTKGLGPGWKSQGTRFWLGVQRNTLGPFQAITNNDEPGWGIPNCPAHVDGGGLPHCCRGCFMHDKPTGSLPYGDAGVDAPLGPASVTAKFYGSQNVTMETAPVTASAQVVCEREPVGSRSTACNGDGSFCFNVPATQGKKSYLFNPNPTPAASADMYCRKLADGSAASLVVFDSRAEREEVVYELIQIGQVPMGGTATPQEFWIGLHSEWTGGDAGPDANPVSWLWDNGLAAGATSTSTPPSIWGDRQPGDAGLSAHGPPSYAFIQLSGGTATSAYAVGLAQVDSDSDPYPFVCQY